MRTSLFLAVVSFSLTVASVAQDRPATTAPTDAARVFVTDSESWSVGGQSGGAGGAFGGSSSGGARPQTAEIIKTFGERCPQVKVNNKQERDYIVVLDHEGGKSILQHRNKVAVFNRVSGDSITSKSTLSLGGSAAADAAQERSVPTATPTATKISTAKLQIESTPPGSDIEVDGSFVGSTPSDVQVAEGDHVVVVKKSGFKSWERKLKASAGSSVHISAELEKADNP